MFYAMKKITNMQQQAGFTILELMIAVTVAGILATLALPSLGDLIKNNRMAAQANSVIASLHYTRNESVNRGVNVRIEPVTAGTDWSDGWLVRIDGNNDGDFNDAEDTVLRNYEGLKRSTLTSDQNTITYSPNGQVNTAALLTLLADECTRDHKRLINVKLSGMIWLDQNDMACP